ncbi:extracellular solute-binding protein [Paenibacillus montanisoli]|uniref:ABC transporter substrate-binding protein n=1 Tax=Paenibacillus montanisoli TaxID=2081970 RepID=A0A328TZS6_9BACL|nr:extracellular solute-binding protein [Paenibacillus montanisoli]RAP74681.1 ABC transporter substrate-binding protein [Paenibacillus montanisoli]
MNNVKLMRAFSLVITATLVLAGCAGGIGNNGKNPSEGGKVDYYKLPETVEMSIVKPVLPGLKLKSGETLEDNEYTDYVLDKTNIKTRVLWSASSTDFDQKMQLAIASNDIPDVMVVNEKTFRAMAAADQLEDLTDVYERYASPQLQDFYRSTEGRALEKATYEGKLMALPSVSIQADAPSILWLRQDWLDKLKLQAPKTIDDFKNVLKAFVENDPDGNGKADTIGLTGNSITLASPIGGLHDFKGIFNAFNSYPLIWTKDEKGQVVYGSTLPGTKQALSVLHEMYVDGLIDKEFALRKTPDDLVLNGKTGSFFGPWWTPWALIDPLRNNPESDWRPFMIQDANGQYNIASVPVSNFFFVVRKGYEHPEAAVVYNNMRVQAERTPDEQAKKLDPGHGLWPLLMTIDYADAATRKHDLLVEALAGTVKKEDMDGEMQIVYEQALRDRQHPRGNANDWGPPAAYLLGGGILKMPMNVTDPVFSATTKTMERNWANLQKLETETFYKIILGDAPLNAFDQFVADWKAQGGNKIIEEITEELKK